MIQTKVAAKVGLRAPAMMDLLDVRAFDEKIMVRSNGNFVAGYRLKGIVSYFYDDFSRVETHNLIDALLRVIPEESMRVQFRYEVGESARDVIEGFKAARTVTNENIEMLDKFELEGIESKEARGEYLTRNLCVYFIWDPVKYKKMMSAAGAPGASTTGQNQVNSNSNPLSKLFSSFSAKAQIQRSKKEHDDLLFEFEMLLKGIESSLDGMGAGPQRMDENELFLEIKRCMNPVRPNLTPYRDPEYANFDRMSPAEQLATESIIEETPLYINISGLLYTAVTLKITPDASYPGLMRDLLTIGFPVVVSTYVEIPDQRVVLDKYKKRYNKMINAQKDHRGNYRPDMRAEKAAEELKALQMEIMASNTKTARVGLSVVVRTSTIATTSAEYESAKRELSVRKQDILHVFSRMNGAQGQAESLATRRIILSTYPGMSAEDVRDHELLTTHASDMVPIEMPWDGTPKSPVMVFPTPWRQLIPFSHFDPDIENANAIIAATSGTGKSLFVGKMLMAYARTGALVSILERGDSYYWPVVMNGGQMITMSLDCESTINPFDLEPGLTEPPNDQLSFIKNLVRYMIGSSGNVDEDLLDNIIQECIKSIYVRARYGVDKAPVLSDLATEMQYFKDKNKTIEETAHLAASKLQMWIGDGLYANLFDRRTTVNMQIPWLYFNIEKLKDDPRVETAMSLVIAYAATVRASGKADVPSIIALDECWSLLENVSTSRTVVQLFRTARKRRAAVFGISQAVEDFSGTPENPLPIGGAILSTTATKMIGRQKGNFDVLRHFLHLNDTTINKIKSLPMTGKGSHSEFLLTIGEKADTTHSIYVEMNPYEYWQLTTYPPERSFRKRWMERTENMPKTVAFAMLARAFPKGISAVFDRLPSTIEEIDNVIDELLKRPEAA